MARHDQKLITHKGSRKARSRRRVLLGWAGTLLASVLMSALLVFLVELIARGSFEQTVDFFRQPFRPGWTTVILFTLFLIGFDALLGRKHAGIFVLAPVTLILAAIGHQKSFYLGDPLYPADFLYVRQIMELAPLLVVERPWTAILIVACGVIGAGILTLIWLFWRRRTRPLRWHGRAVRLAVVVPALAFFFSIMDFATFSWTRDRLQIIPIMWDQKENYASNGFAIAFALNVPMAKVLAPPAYSDDVLDAIEPDRTEIVMPDQKPDIIMVMSESFWDPTELPETTITPDPMPNVRKLQSGTMFSPEFGGMTANVEFEALTGFSNAFLPYGSIPYQQYVREPVPTLASFLRDEGYETTAIHPFEGWFWNREIVYDSFGFDTFLSSEKLPVMSKRGQLVSDDAVTDQVIRHMESTDNPSFIFAVTLQGHGPYEPYRYINPEISVDSVASYRTRQSIRSYAEGIADADRSLKRLLDWAQNRDRETIVVFFGDHLPPLNAAYVETGFMEKTVPDRRESAEKLAKFRQTPLVVWSNKTGPMEDIGSISPSLIPLKLLQKAGIEHPYYTGFLKRIDEQYDVIDRHVLIAPDGATPDWSNEKLVDPLINDFRLLQYDTLFGRKRTMERFFPNFTRPAGV